MSDGPHVPQQEKQARALCFGLGAWGVLTGFALFLLLVEKLDRPWIFVAALSIAAVASYVLEFVRQLIEDDGEPHPAGPRIASAILLIVIAELFVGALGALPNVSPLIVSALSELFLGDLAASLVPPLVSLAAVALAWMGVGGAISVQLLQSLDDAGEGPRRIARGAWHGALTGALVAPAALLICVIVLRVVAHVYLMVGHYDAWAAHLDALGSQNGLLWLLVLPVKWLGALWTSGWWGPPAVLAIVGFGAWSLKRDSPLGLWLLWSFGAVLLLPMLVDLIDLLWVLLLAAVVWAVPTAAIGAFAPLLRKPADDTRTWGGVALGGAILLTLITLLRLGSWWFLLPAALLALTAFLLRRGRAPEEWWPLLALTASLAVAGVTWVFQQATFEGIFERVHALSSPTGAIPPAPRPFTQADLEAWRRLHGPIVKYENPFMPQWTKAWQADAVYAEARAGMDASYAWIGPREKADLGPRILSIRTWHRAYLAAEKREGIARLEPLKKLQRELRSEMTPQPGRLEFAITEMGKKRHVYLRHAERVVGSDVAELEGAHRIAPETAPADPKELADRLIIATFGAPRWRVPGLRLLAQRAKGRLARQTTLVERVALEKLTPRPGMGASALSTLAKRLAATPWQTENAEAQAARLGTDIEAQFAAAAFALDVRLRKADEALDALPELERVGAANTLHAEIEREREALGAGPLHEQLGALAARVESRRDAWRAENKRNAIRLLELAICGSLGFWVSVALLGGWALRHRRSVAPT